MKRIFGYQWSEFNSDGRVNFGDLLTEIVFERLGYKYRPYKDAPQGAPLTLAIGTILDPERVKYSGSNQTIVWGSGYRESSSDLRSFIEEGTLDVRAARGPLTLAELHLPKDIPCGDPALLLSNYYTARMHGDAIVIPHWRRYGAQLCAPGRVRYRSPFVPRDRVLEVALEIAGASFVLTGSLHGAIIAHAFRIPWALWKGYQEHSSKWQDWAISCITIALFRFI